MAADITAEAFLCTKEKRSLSGNLSPLRTAVAAAGASGTAICFLSCFETGVNTALGAVWAVIACILFGTVFCLKRKFILPCALTLSAGFTGAVFILRERFCNGLANVINIYLAALNKQFRERPFIELLYPDSADGDTAVFIALTAFFIGMVYSWGLVLHSSLPAVLAVSGLPLELCLYFGFAPNYIAFFMVVASWFAVFAGELSTPDSGSGSIHRKAASQCSFAAAAMVFICALAVISAVRIGGYERPESVRKVYDSITDYLKSGKLEETIEDIKISEIIKHESAINHGRLGENGNITFSGDTALQVTMPKSSDTVYLRGYVGSVYTGNSWEELPQSSQDILQKINDGFRTEDLNTMLLGSYNLWLAEDLSESSFVVKNVGAGKDYFYVPYNLVPASVTHFTIKNDAVISTGADTWFGRYYNNPTACYGYSMLLNTAWTVPSLTLANDISSYRNFVYSDNYLAVPDNFKGADEVFDERYYSFITAESSTGGKSTLTSQAVFGRKLYYIRSWLRDNCEYSLSVGKLPSGKDFADYFLTETKAGSCSHFATSAVLLCRYAGIPARYVEGYVIKPADFDESAAVGDVCTVDVTDARAHAWAEVYIDGFGWYPMEFTSGYGNVMTAVTTARTEEETEPEEAVSESVTETEPEETAVTTVTEISDGTENAETVITSQDAAVTSVTKASDTPDSKTGFSIFGGSSGGKQYEKVYDLTVPLGIALAVCAVIAALALKRWLLVKKCREISGRKNAAQLQYKRFMKLVKAAGLPSKGRLSYNEYALKLQESPITADTAETVIGTALKAEFSGETLTKEENDNIRRAVNRSVKRYYDSLNRLQKFYAEFILGLV
ncbi:MAG: transglutaminase domain-containing protein [Oscillospiraceae bacterium]|nr:transglutaminase domain-containing protein [Oscillospiraceae bacterium]